MALEVLQRREQIDRARAGLEERAAASVVSTRERVAKLWDRLRGRSTARPFIDILKSWDVLRTAEFIEKAFPATARILDIGAFNSEILSVLHAWGFQQLSGIDMNPKVLGMPSGGAIRYVVGDFLGSPFPDESFDVVTAISVIEHGFDGPRLLGEVSRLLRPGGCFVASFDYWPDKIDTSDTQFFGMDWRIFSRAEVEDLLATAGVLGLRPDGPMSFDSEERPIHCGGRSYTFGWLVLRK